MIFSCRRHKLNQRLCAVPGIGWVESDLQKSTQESIYHWRAVGQCIPELVFVGIFIFTW